MVLTSLSPLLSFSSCRVVEELTCALRCKEALITELSGQKSVLALKVGELEGQVVDLSSSLLQKERDAEVYIIPVTRMRKSACVGSALGSMVQ